MGNKGLYENIGPTIRGNTTEERVRTREIVVLAEEATSQFSFAAHKSSAMFTLLEEQDPKASILAMENRRKTLSLLNTIFDLRQRKGDNWDCVLFLLFQNASNVYLIDLVKDLPNLKRFYSYDGFARRESAKVTGEWSVSNHRGNTLDQEANSMSERVAVCFRIGVVCFAVGEG